MKMEDHSRNILATKQPAKKFANLFFGTLWLRGLRVFDESDGGRKLRIFKRRSRPRNRVRMG